MNVFLSLTMLDPCIRYMYFDQTGPYTIYDNNINNSTILPSVLSLWNLHIYVVNLFPIKLILRN